MSYGPLKDLFLAFEQANAHWRRSMRLGPNEFLVLFHLWMREEPMAMGDVSRLVNITSGGLTAVVARLERSGYLQRIPDEDDRRRMRLELTDRGAEARLAFLALIWKGERELAEMPEDERETVLRCMRRITAALHDLPATSRGPAPGP